MEELIYRYFPELTILQREQFRKFYPLYEAWNNKINLISRKDIEHLYLHHVLHSLAIAKLLSFFPGDQVLDVGTGGGFPGIPLAILFPDTSFTLCDSILKKITAVKDISYNLGLKNIATRRIRAEDVEGEFDYVVSRAVAPLEIFLPWIWKKVKTGVIYLKGNSLDEEIARAAHSVQTDRSNFMEISISDWFNEIWFNEKKIVYVKR